LILRIFNHVAGRGEATSDSKADFFRPKRLASLRARADANQKDVPMTFLGPFLGRLSVVTAYVAFAFVGAIVLGVF